MSALPLLEKVRVLCADIERRRLAVSNVLPDSTKSKQSIATEKANQTLLSTSSSSNKNNNQHENVEHIRDHFTLRQADAVRESSNAILDSLDGEELERLAQLFLSSRLSLAKATMDNNNSTNNDQHHQSGKSNFHFDKATTEILDSAPDAQHVAARALDSFEKDATRLRDYHRNHSNQQQHRPSSYHLPQLERPNDQDIHRIRNTLFSGPERKGKAVDLNAAYKHFRDFQTKSSLASSQAGVVVIDQEITYSDFVRDPIKSASTVSIKRKLDSSSQMLYLQCLSSAAISLEKFVTKIRPLSAASEIKETREKVTALISQLKSSKSVSSFLTSTSSSSSSSGKNFITDSNSNFSDKVKEVWKKFSFSQHIAPHPVGEERDRIINVLFKILQLVEHISLLMTNVIGDSIFTSTADHINRCALRSTAEEHQDEEDDELRFQQDFFETFYAHPPLSDRVGLTLSDSGAGVAANLTELEKIQQLTSLSSSSSSNLKKNDGDDDDANTQDHQDFDSNNIDDLSPEQRAKLTNPKNFPLDALGRPIPPWLFKLHQLDKKKYCEICNHSFPGEKVFVQHFGEPRHEAGLAALGIKVTPMNARHFELISTRQGVLEAHKRLLEGEANAKRRMRGDDVEEEDATGNIVTIAQRQYVQQF